ncbi:MAG: nicotinate phosphoribosyltransferase, partial [Nitriliruptorales bacterium]|nr:nicotinate phosphoribosyltransferase [Nitriliruptorales bacterium]
DGTVVLADEPLLEFTAPLPVAQLLETAVMNVVHLPTMIATKAARCVVASQGRLLADFGARRAHGVEAALEAARAAYLAGFDSTSNVEAGRRYGIPIAGTMAHALVQSYEDEIAAFRAFARDHPGNAVLLVDTYDTLEGVDNAILVGRELLDRGEELNGVRLDSGDFHELAIKSRKKLDEAGFEDASIFASGGMDEWAIHDLLSRDAPIDAFGIGTGLTTSRDHPAADIVYKLVDYDGKPRAKYSEGKVLRPGAKQIFRTAGPDTDVLGRRGEEHDGTALLAPAWRDGQRLRDDDLEAARQHAAGQLESLPEAWRHPDGPEEIPHPAISPELEELTEQVRARELA